ncbi:MAG: hypothetical protein L0I24_00250 [Pseudonocardia sp.]|nr:hypothetical protein [Pseudonocardia sp.]
MALVEVQPLASAAVVIAWFEGNRARTGTVTVTADGVELDAALDLLVDGLEASTDPVYTVEVGVIVERTERVKKPRKPSTDNGLPVDPGDVAPEVPAPGPPDGVGVVLPARRKEQQ